MVQGVIDFKIIAIVELLSGEVITFTLPFSILWGAGGTHMALVKQQLTEQENILCVMVLKLALLKKPKEPPPALLR